MAGSTRASNMPTSRPMKTAHLRRWLVAPPCDVQPRTPRSSLLAASHLHRFARPALMLTPHRRSPLPRFARPALLRPPPRPPPLRRLVEPPPLLAPRRRSLV